MLSSSKNRETGSITVFLSGLNLSFGVRNTHGQYPRYKVKEELEICQCKYVRKTCFQLGLHMFYWGSIIFISMFLQLYRIVLPTQLFLVKDAISHCNDNLLKFKWTLLEVTVDWTVWGNIQISLYNDSRLGLIEHHSSFPFAVAIIWTLLNNIKPCPIYSYS